VSAPEINLKSANALRKEDRAWQGCRAGCEPLAYKIMAVFYDTHAHLDYPDYADDLAQVIERAAAAGITRMIAIGTDLESSARVLKLAEQFAGVYAAVGWHPCHALEAPDDLRPALRELARHSKVVAIGETGLDYHGLPSPESQGTQTDADRYKQKQAAIFRQQMEMAAESGLNCIVHQRDALEDVLAQMLPFAGKVRGVFHCFVNDAVDLRRILAMGSLVSFTGIVTFKNAQLVRDTVAATPLDRLMLETDCPYLAPTPHRGKRCEPAYVKEIAEVVAGVKGCSLEELSLATCDTAVKFFPRMK
jgi:TatD DNase family protein